MKAKFNFTDSAISKITPPHKNVQKLVFSDNYQRGLVLIVGYGGKKAFYFRGKQHKKKIMFKIGEFPYMNTNKAREKVFVLYNDLKRGILQQPDIKQQQITLKQLFYDEYIPKHAKIFKKHNAWQINERTFKTHFKIIENIGIDKLTRNNIDIWHKSIGKNSGIYMANRCLALIRHMLNMAIDWGLLTINPAQNIRQFKEVARDRFLQPAEITNFMQALMGTTNEMFKHFILLLLYTGQRKANILALRWEHINLHNCILYLPDTKNNQSQQIPLTKQAINVLKDIGIKDFGWVFPSKQSTSGHMENPKRYWAELLKKANITNLRMHDLRRTMGSYQAIVGSSMNIISKSLGHKSIQSTAVYARLSLEPVRESMQKATDEIMKY